MKAEMWTVQIISTDIIKPSSPTPPHLRRLQLSWLDQLTDRIYIRLVLFYSNDGGSPLEKSHQLKKSLSETLSRFYPLAGRMEGNSSIECNDMGADFIEARVEGQLSDFLRAPQIEAVNGFLPCDVIRTRSGRAVLLAIQVNVFDCGGLAIGVGISHKITDAASLIMFLNGWAATARGVDEVASPAFISAALFPPMEIPPTIPSSMISSEKNLVTKRFVFDGPKIAILRSRSPNATRVEVVSALIWQCIMRAGPTRAAVVVHAVNLRRRMVPPLPDHSFGNLVRGAISSVEAGVGQRDMQRYLENQLRDAIRKVDDDYIRRLMQGSGGPQEALRTRREFFEKKHSESGMDLCVFTSWCGFPIYDADFGWGRPTWISLCPIHVRNTTVLMETRSGDGMEAWICMEMREMAQLEQDQDLLTFASLPAGSGFCEASLN